MHTTGSQHSLFASVKEIIVSARQQAYRNSNSILLHMYWQIGQLIIEEKQGGKEKAAYGKAVLKNLSRQLTEEFGKGFDERNLNNIRAFYSAFPIWNAVRTELSWTHYRIISRIENEDFRLQYVAHSIEGNWDTRTLQRNINTHYLGRILELPAKNEHQTAAHFIKDPYIFEVRHGTLYYILGSAKGLLKRTYPSQPVYLDPKGKGESSILVKRSLEIKYANQSSARLVWQAES